MRPFDVNNFLRPISHSGHSKVVRNSSHSCATRNFIRNSFFINYFSKFPNISRIFTGPSIPTLLCTWLCRRALWLECCIYKLTTTETWGILHFSSKIAPNSKNVCIIYWSIEKIFKLNFQILKKFQHRQKLFKQQSIPINPSPWFSKPLIYLFSYWRAINQSRFALLS